MKQKFPSQISHLSYQGYEIILLFFTFFKLHLFILLIRVGHKTHGEVRVQLANVGSLLLSCRSQELNSGPQVW